MWSACLPTFRSRGLLKWRHVYSVCFIFSVGRTSASRASSQGCCRGPRFPWPSFRVGVWSQAEVLHAVDEGMTERAPGVECSVHWQKPPASHEGKCELKCSPHCLCQGMHSQGCSHQKGHLFLLHLTAPLRALLLCRVPPSKGGGLVLGQNVHHLLFGSRSKLYFSNPAPSMMKLILYFLADTGI